MYISDGRDILFNMLYEVYAADVRPAFKKSTAFRPELTKQINVTTVIQFDLTRIRGEKFERKIHEVVKKNKSSFKRNNGTMKGGGDLLRYKGAVASGKGAAYKFNHSVIKNLILK